MQTHNTELLPWHEEAFARLRGFEQADRLAHAYLLQGPEGVGKTVFARHLAHTLLCRAPDPQQKPCNHCSHCRLVLAGSHPDLRMVEPEEGARNIRIEQVRNTLEFMSKTSQQGGRKIVILAPAEAMNLNAANALLKALEEPAAGTLLMLISHHPALLLPTIRSRCQVLRLDKPDEQQATAWLTSKNAEQIPVLLRLADGAPLRALRLADADALHERSVLHATLARLLRGESNAVQAALDCGKFNINDNLEGMMLALGDLLRFVQSDGGVALRDPDLQPLARGLGKRGLPAVRGMHALNRQVLEARRAIVSNANPNPQLILESLFFSWSNLARTAIVNTTVQS